MRHSSDGYAGEQAVGDILLKKGLLEEITSFIIYYMDLGIVSRSCENVKEFLNPFVDACS